MLRLEARESGDSWEVRDNGERSVSDGAVMVIVEKGTVISGVLNGCKGAVLLGTGDCLTGTRISNWGGGDRRLLMELCGVRDGVTMGWRAARDSRTEDTVEAGMKRSPGGNLQLTGWMPEMVVAMVVVGAVVVTVSKHDICNGGCTL